MFTFILSMKHYGQWFLVVGLFPFIGEVIKNRLQVIHISRKQTNHQASHWCSTTSKKDNRWQFISEHLIYNRQFDKLMSLICSTFNGPKLHFIYHLTLKVYFVNLKCTKLYKKVISFILHYIYAINDNRKNVIEFTPVSKCTYRINAYIFWQMNTFPM